MKLSLTVLAILGVVSSSNSFPKNQQQEFQQEDPQHQYRYIQQKNTHGQTFFAPQPNQYQYHNQNQQDLHQQSHQKKYDKQRQTNNLLSNKSFLSKQKFLLEIVYRIENPLMFEEWIELGKAYTFNSADYTYSDVHMEKFFQAYKAGYLLPRGEFFGALVNTHSQEAFALFKVFYFAKNFDVFQSCVAWARMQINEAMFIYALNLAVTHRPDFQGVVLPAIYEIFPQNFFHSKFIYNAEKFDYDIWSKLAMYEKEYNDILDKEYRNQFKQFGNQYYLHTKDFKLWQWWKLMGLGENWYCSDHLPIRNSFYEDLNKDSKLLQSLEKVKFFWMPVDYSRDIDVNNKEDVLTYFTEDVGLNAFWYYFNLENTLFVEGKMFGANKYNRGEQWLYTVRQLLARYYQERLSNDLGEIPYFAFDGQIKAGYDPQMTFYNGVGYSVRKDYYTVQSFGNRYLYQKISSFFQRLDDAISTGYYKTIDGNLVNLRKPKQIEAFVHMIQENVDLHDQYFFYQWFQMTHMYLSNIQRDDPQIYPNVFLNYETMMRDPLFYMVYKKTANSFYQLFYNQKPYTKQELIFSGVNINDVKISDLTTYFDLVDFDVSNLLNGKMSFVDGQFVWDKALLARQLRLNHKPFTYELSVQSDKAQEVVVKAFLAPKYDEYGRLLSLSNNQENFVELDIMVCNIQPGINTIKRVSRDFYATKTDRSTYTELYKHAMFAYENNLENIFNTSNIQRSSGFPNQLLLPRGSSKGFPMQFFFFIYPYNEISDAIQFTSHTYGYSEFVFKNKTAKAMWKNDGTKGYTNSKPFGYPFNRAVDELEFQVPNMYFKDVKIYHTDTFSKLAIAEKFSKSYGVFDYNTYYNNFYYKDSTYNNENCGQQ